MKTNICDTVFSCPNGRSGVYILQLSKKKIKIGRSKTIESRIKQYKGYQCNGKIPKCLLKVITVDYISLEKILHQFAVQCKLKRLGKLEIFTCTNIKTFLQQIETFLSHRFKLAYHKLTKTELLICKNMKRKNNLANSKITFGKYKGKTFKQMRKILFQNPNWYLQQEKKNNEFKNLKRFLALSL